MKMPSLINGTLWMGLVLVLGVGAAAYYHIENLIASSRNERHVVETMRQLELFGGALAETEYAALQLAFAPRDAMMMEFLSAKGRTVSQMQQLRDRAPDAEVRLLLADLDRALNEHLNELQFVANATAPDLARPATSARSQTRRNVNTILDAIRKTESMALQRFESTTASEGGNTAFFIFGGAGIASCLVLLAMHLANRNQRLHELSQARLQTETERFTYALEGSGTAAWDWNFLHNDVFLSPMWFQFLGEPPNEAPLPSSELFALVHPDDAERVQALISDVATNKTATYEAEHRVRRSDGDYLWIASRGKVIERDAQGKPLRFTGTNRNITAEKNAELALADSERQTRQIIDAVPAPIAYTDAAGCVRLCNQAVSTMLGVPVDRIIGQNISQLFSEQTYRDIHPHVLRAMAGEQVQFERTQRLPHGGTVDFSTTYIPRHDAQGRAQGFYSMTTDISELKRLDRMKSEFVSTVSHELRTPLTSIRGSLGLLSGGLAGALPDKAKGLIEIAKNNCERLIRLINDILDIEKIESEKMVFKSTPIDLTAFIEQALKANEGFANQYRTQLRVTAALPDARVNGDQDRLIQVMTNLISNACKFSPPDSTVDIALTRADGFIRIAVIDHGPGISEEFTARIFQRFSQADSTDTKQKGGTGLGLAISKTIVEHLGGQMGFESELGKGSSFYFTLPEITTT